MLLHVHLLFFHYECRNGTTAYTGALRTSVPKSTYQNAQFQWWIDDLKMDMVFRMMSLTLVQDAPYLCFSGKTCFVAATSVYGLLAF